MVLLRSGGSCDVPVVTLGILQAVLTLAVVLVRRLAQDRRAVSLGMLEVRVDIGHVHHDATCGRARQLRRGQTAGRGVEPDALFAGSHLAVDDRARAVLDEASGGEAEHVDEEVMTGTDVLVRHHRDEIEERVRHRRHTRAVSRPAIPLSRHLLRVRDLIDRAYAEDLDVAALARSAAVSPAYFSRSFKAAFGETPHQYLMTRRMERAKALLRAGELTVTDVCFAVGFSSLGSFSTQFKRLVGESPSTYRQRDGHGELARLPSCYVRMWTRPQLGSFREARELPLP